MKEILRLTFSVTLICAIAGACLALVSHITAARIEANQNTQRTAKMLMVLPPTSVITEADGKSADGDVDFFVAKDIMGTPVAYCAIGRSNDGFGGMVTVMAGLTIDGRITSLLVSEHNETPGIGSRVCNRSVKESLWEKLSGKSQQGTGLAPNAYLDSYSGRKLSPEGFQFASDNSGSHVVAVSGATFSSTAVLHAVNKICTAWQERPAAASLQ